MAAKISLIKLDSVLMTDGSPFVSRRKAYKAAYRTPDNEDLFFKLTVDTDLDKKAQLIVPPTHVALLIKDGQMLKTLESGKYDVYDKKSDLAGIFIKRFSTDSVEIIYMSRTAKLRMPWGTPQLLDLRDPITDSPVKVGANGEFEIQIGEPRKFYLELVGLDTDYDVDKLQERLLNRLMSEFKPALAKIMREKKLTYTIVDEYLKEIADGIAPILGNILLNEYGVSMYSFFINNI
ncbi:MAG: SPFH domain-containing protein, partial [Clostridiales bacterium]|nr:SPFH domain-containing protein [Clostridiales bacterium]